MAPAIASFSPTTGPTGGGTQVTIQGTGFATNAQVRFGTTLSSNVQVASSTLLTAIAPAASEGAVTLRVVNPGTGLTAVSSGLFTYQAGAAAAPPPGGGGGGGDCALGSPAEGGSTPLGLLALLLALLALRRRFGA
ncbi:MAG: IPT/TIG domain-containing protein [Planctomycetota bacterium]